MREGRKEVCLARGEGGGGGTALSVENGSQCGDLEKFFHFSGQPASGAHTAVRSSVVCSRYVEVLIVLRHSRKVCVGH